MLVGYMRWLIASSAIARPSYVVRTRGHAALELPPDTCGDFLWKYKVPVITCTFKCTACDDHCRRYMTLYYYAELHRHRGQLGVSRGRVVIYRCWGTVLKLIIILYMPYAIISSSCTYAMPWRQSASAHIYAHAYKSRAIPSQ